MDQVQQLEAKHSQSEWSSDKEGTHEIDEIFHQGASQTLSYCAYNKAQKTSELEDKIEDKQYQLLQWHYRLGHVPFDVIKAMSLAGELPGGLSRCPTPKCVACLYGKATRRPWRTRTPPNQIAAVRAKSPGLCVSVDQLE